MHVVCRRDQASIISARSPLQSVAMTTTASTIPNLLLKCTSFSSLNIQQPYIVSVASNALMIMVKYLYGTCVCHLHIGYTRKYDEIYLLPC